MNINSRDFLKGRKILITSFSYANFGGAELNAVELAEQLVEFGMKPQFFSYDIDGPLARRISEKFHTNPITDDVNLLAESEADLGYTKLDISDYDYIWVGANMVPISILKQINTAKKLPKFIFIHMSQLIGFPMDAPLLAEFEEKIASRVLSISQKTTEDCIQRVLPDDISLSMWRNPAPKDFRAIKKRSGELKKVAVISSSHPTEEIMGIKELLQEKDIEVEYVGRFNDNAKVVDAGFYDKYDLIVGIGKNTQYSLVSGVPIYIYGRFGGGGYLTGSNYGINEANNFSGRGFARKSTDMIAAEIVNGYKNALLFHEVNRNKYIQEYSIDVVAENLFRELESEPQKKITFSERYINLLVSMQINFIQNMKRFGGSRSMESRLVYLEDLTARQKDELDSVYNSKSWSITRPIRAVVGFLRRIKI